MTTESRLIPCEFFFLNPGEGCLWEQSSPGTVSQRQCSGDLKHSLDGFDSNNHRLLQSPESPYKMKNSVRFFS